MTTPDRSTKVCHRCGVRHPRSAFSTNPGRYDGLASYCRPCERDRARGYRATPEGREASRRAVREYRRRRAAAARPESPGDGLPG